MIEVEETDLGDMMPLAMQAEVGFFPRSVCRNRKKMNGKIFSIAAKFTSGMSRVEVSIS